MKTFSDSEEVVVFLSRSELGHLVLALSSALVRYGEPGFNIDGVSGSFFDGCVRPLFDSLEVLHENLIES